MAWVGAPVFVASRQLTLHTNPSLSMHGQTTTGKPQRSSIGASSIGAPRYGLVDHQVRPGSTRHHRPSAFPGQHPPLWRRAPPQTPCWLRWSSRTAPRSAGCRAQTPDGRGGALCCLQRRRVHRRSAAARPPQGVAAAVAGDEAREGHHHRCWPSCCCRGCCCSSVERRCRWRRCHRRRSLRTGLLSACTSCSRLHALSETSTGERGP